jgi:glycosyltransferase involved in cell wall biosynthesis
MISVAIATYNGARFIERQLQSILAQTMLPDEIVVCDDCSQDETIAILKSAQQRSKIPFRISANAKRLGYIKNFERAIMACSGSVIFLSDQDNVWFPEKIERMLAADQSALLVHSDAVLVDKSETTISESYSQSSKKHIHDSSFARVLCSNPVSGCTTMIRRELLDDLSEFPEWMPHDQWLALLAADRESLTYLPECLISFRQHENNTLGAGSNMQKSGIRISSLQVATVNHDKKALLLRKTAGFAKKLISEKNIRILDDLARYHESLGSKRRSFLAAALYMSYSRYIDFGTPWIIRALKGIATPFRFART